MSAVALGGTRQLATMSTRAVSDRMPMPKVLLSMMRLNFVCSGLCVRARCDRCEHDAPGLRIRVRPAAGADAAAGLGVHVAVAAAARDAAARRDALAGGEHAIDVDR